MQLSQSVEKMMYYILRPESNPKSTIFVPVNNQKLVSKMRELMNKDEINAMHVRMKDRTLEWEKDVRFRTESFLEILSNGVNQDLILMIRCLHRKRQELVQLGKKLPARDSNTLKNSGKAGGRGNLPMCCISNARKLVTIYEMFWIRQRKELAGGQYSY